MAWSASFRIGSGFLADSYLRSDPPSVGELEKVRATWPARSRGSTAGQRRSPSAGRRPRCAGWAPSSPTRRSSAGSACSARPRSQRSPRFELDPERVRLCPGILVLEAISDLLALPLRIARGGLREGVLLELVEGRRLA